MNSSTNKEIISAYGLSNIDPIPYPTPVVNVNPKDYKLTFNAYTNPTSSGANTILTTSSTRKTFITNAQLSFTKNATCDIASGSLALVIKDSKGLTQHLVGLAILTLTAERGEISVTFDKPVEVAKNYQIQLNGTFTAGTMIRYCNINYYELEEYES